MNIQTYVEKIESAAQLARKLDIDPAMISQWKTGVRSIPVERMAAIEAATDGHVTRKDLRPKDWQYIWPELVKKRDRK